MRTGQYPIFWDIQKEWDGKIKFDGASRRDVGYVIRKKGFHQQIAIPYPPSYMMARPLPYVLKSPHVPKEARVGNISELLTPTPRAYKIGNLLPWSFPHTLLETHNKSVSIRVFVVDAASNSPLISKLGAVRGYQNVDGDELWYVYRGNGMVRTELGALLYGAGDYLYIPRGFIYEIYADLSSVTHTDTNNTILVGVESTRPLLRPLVSMDDVPYSIRDMRVPLCEQTMRLPVVLHDCENPYVLAVKRSNAWSFLAYFANPTACFGWSGTPYPFIVNEKYINVPVVDTVHTDPTQFIAFVTGDESVAVSIFRPRRVHSIPYYHDNTYDECMFLIDTYAARAGSVAMGDMTFHPQGFCHGPQPNAFSMAPVVGDPQHNRWDRERAVMFESRQPLVPTRESIAVELLDYWKSWIPGN
ncbi:MAG: homogentisate 1,2-dioxygenase [Parcubacteria group bacterium Gr01-1014_48]|nr:MAG: homogentisate 1,2-dioxygenase [Parcubacteria group bacterium Gr01-1014_48]